MGFLEQGLMEAAAVGGFEPGDVEREDACPRSVEEAVWNVQFHDDRSVRYYGLWWIYRFKVAEAEGSCVHVLKTSDDQTELGGFGIRRRAALALGAIAAAPTSENDAAVVALADALESTDYYLRYRAAEALANIAQRASRDATVGFPPIVAARLRRLLEDGQRDLARKREAATGYTKQEGLFDLENLEPDVRARLEKVFQDRRENEQRSRRTTMTPQLGVDEVSHKTDQPFEWILKAIAAISATSPEPIDDPALLETLQCYTDHPIPLIRYAAHKALYALSDAEKHAEAIVGALGYGVEHHYSQRVLIRDLGDLGYAPGAAAVAGCPMVENSFKILALKNMLAKEDHDPSNADVRNVLVHMDSLL